MIGWVHEACRSWGRAKYWVMFGKGGYPTRTMLGKLIEEGVVGAACSQFTMEYPEVLMDENLKMENAIKTLPETPRTVITIHYVFRLPTKAKYAKLGIGKGTYYDALAHAHTMLEARYQVREMQDKLREVGQNRPNVSGICQVV